MRDRQTDRQRAGKAVAYAAITDGEQARDGAQEREIARWRDSMREKERDGGREKWMER